MRMQKSSEDYLEMILMLREKKGYARSVDIAGELCVTKPSVSYAVKRLRQNGYITMDTDGMISLTASGMEVASRMYERHKLIAALLMAIGVDEETARTDACKVEHDLSDKSFDAIRRYARQGRKDNLSETAAD